jgi:DNA transposition AAA+ family ATPase
VNNPENTAVDIEAERAWLMAHKSASGLSWKLLGNKADVPGATLSLFGTGQYAGNNENVAVRVLKFRQMVESQAHHATSLPTHPDFLHLNTASRLRGLMVHAQGGRMVLAATGPGMCKSFTMAEYAASAAPVWTVTGCPSMKTLASLIGAVSRSVGAMTKGGWIHPMSDAVVGKTRGSGGLLIVDEAGHLSLEMLEQLRHWHDASLVNGVYTLGICLLGNRDLYQRVRGGTRHDAYGALNSRIAYSHYALCLEAAEVEDFLDAWGIMEPEMRKPLIRIGTTPSAGGLREIKQIIESATMVAHEDGAEKLSMSQLREAMALRSTGGMAA